MSENWSFGTRSRILLELLCYWLLNSLTDISVVCCAWFDKKWGLLSFEVSIECYCAQLSFFQLSGFHWALPGFYRVFDRVKPGKDSSIFVFFLPNTRWCCRRRASTCWSRPARCTCSVACRTCATATPRWGWPEANVVLLFPLPCRGSRNVIVAKDRIEVDDEFEGVINGVIKDEFNQSRVQECNRC